LHLHGWADADNPQKTLWNELMGVAYDNPYEAYFRAQGAGHYFYLVNPGAEDTSFGGENTIVVGMNDAGETLLFGHPSGVKTTKQWIGELGEMQRSENYDLEETPFQGRGSGSYAGLARLNKTDDPRYLTWRISTERMMSNFKYYAGMLERLQQLSLQGEESEEARPQAVVRSAVPVEIKDFITKHNLADPQ